MTVIFVCTFPKFWCKPGAKVQTCGPLHHRGVVIRPDGGTVAPGPIDLRAEREVLRLLCSKRTGDLGNQESPKMFGARIPVIQRKIDSADEDNPRNQDEIRAKPGRPEEGEESVAPEV